MSKKKAKNGPFRPTLSLVINTFNKPEPLDRILALLVAGKQAPREVVIADDGSDKKTKAIIDKYKTNGKFPIEHAWQEKQGYRRSRILNMAIAKTTGDYVVFMDGDCIPNLHFVEDHCSIAQNNCFVQARRAFIAESSVADYLSGKRSIRKLWLSGKISGLFKTVRWAKPIVKCNQELHGILGCNLGIWKSDLVAVNGYDESFEGWGAEDSDLAARLYHLGRQRLFIYGRAILYHLNHPRLSRERYDHNKKILDATIQQFRIRSKIGLDQYL